MSNECRFDLADNRNYKVKIDIMERKGINLALEILNKLKNFGLIFHLQPSNLFAILEEEDHKEFYDGSEIKFVYMVFGLNCSCYIDTDINMYEEETDCIELDSKRMLNQLYFVYSGPEISPTKEEIKESIKKPDELRSAELLLCKDSSYKVAIPRGKTGDVDENLVDVCMKLRKVGFIICIDNDGFIGNLDEYKYLFLSTSDNEYIGAFDSREIFFDKEDKFTIELLAYDIIHCTIAIIEPLTDTKESQNESDLTCGFEVGDRVYSYSRRDWGIIESVTKNGKYHIKFDNAPGTERSIYNFDCSCESNKSRDLFYDIPTFNIPKKPLPKLDVDTKVLVWNNTQIRDASKTKRHFHSFDQNGKCLTYPGGSTSWTYNNNDLVAWDNWELVHG